MKNILHDINVQIIFQMICRIMQIMLLYDLSIKATREMVEIAIVVLKNKSNLYRGLHVWSYSIQAFF